MSTLVVPVAPERSADTTSRWFVASRSQDGVYWMVTFSPGQSLTCTCPHGRTIKPNRETCRHMRAVLEVEQERVA